MKLDDNVINVEKFNKLTKDQWKNEELEFFACSKCDLIVLGIPDCHIALLNPEDIKVTMNYNLPRNVICPNCKDVWYEFRKNKEYNIKEISVNKFLHSAWGSIFEKNL